jgi:nicotinic acid mononucleotide adenylyltransferase
LCRNSSTFIRKALRRKKIQPIITFKVWEYIDHNNFL